MSIELKQAAQQVLDAFEVFGEADDFATLFTLTQKMHALRTAIQQAESEPVAVRNPFASRCYTMSESHLSGHRLIVGFEKLGDAQDAHEWVARQGRGDFTHPAQSVPADVMRDAERYRWLRKWKGQEHEPPFTVQHEFDGTIWGGDLDSAIDAAMLTAIQAQKSTDPQDTYVNGLAQANNEQE